MHRLILIILATLLSPSLSADNQLTPADSPILIYQGGGDYEEIKSNLEEAITGQGMVVTNTLHISQMLERTAGDTGLSTKIYEQAESLEFCSILYSYKMSLAHPANMATCPLTISIYQKAGDKEHTYLAFRRPRMLGKSADVEKAITRLLGGIVEEALE
jgi:uncharacterized protein (DUF302 family)